MTSYTAPKAIAQHPGVQECIQPDSGFDPVREGGPRHDVFLREDWRFASLGDGDRRSARFRTVKEFNDARPARIQ